MERKILKVVGFLFMILLVTINIYVVFSKNETMNPFSKVSEVTFAGSNEGLYTWPAEYECEVTIGHCSFSRYEKFCVCVQFLWYCNDETGCTVELSQEEIDECLD